MPILPTSSSSSSSSTAGWFVMTRQSVLYSIASIIAIATVITLYTFWMVPAETDFLELQHSYINHFVNHHECHWSNDGSMPVLYNIHTKLGVNYDAGHWFHMSENIMVQHSILRHSNHLTNGSVVYYNFDTEGFTSNLNGITRLIVYLGTIAPKSVVSQLHFITQKSLLRSNILPGDSLKIPTSLLTSHDQYVTLSSDIPTKDRFLKHNAVLPANKPEHHQCVKFMGTLGGRWPTPQRGSWFPNEGDIESFRQKLRDACPADKEMLAKVKKTKPFKLVIYQRDLSRKLANEADALTYIKQRLPEDQWDISVLMHNSKRSPCELSHLLHDTDVLLTPHGFQSMLLLFLPRPSVLFEVFPYRYYKRGYGPLSKEYGIKHGGVMSPATLWHTELILSYVTTSWCMLSKYCRGYARDQDVLLTENGADRLVDMIHEHIVPMKTQTQLKIDALMTSGGSSNSDTKVDNSKALVVRYKNRETLY